MTNRPNSFVRGECDRCGAPLSRAREKGKYVCSYCSAVYYSNDAVESDWEPDIELPPEPSETWKEPVQLPAEPARKNRKTTWVILMGAGLFAVLCMVVLMVASSAGNSASDGSRVSQPKEKPAMLSQLPQAARAGEPVNYANWTLTVNPEISASDNRISISFAVKNWSDDPQIFRYTPNTLLVYDDLGNSYPLSLGRCEPDVPYNARQITVDPDDEIFFESDRSWCSSPNDLPQFSGVIPLEAQKLYVNMSGFGVFQNITFVIEL